MWPASLDFQSTLGISDKGFPPKEASGNFQVMKHYIGDHVKLELEKGYLLQPSSITVNGPITFIAVQISDQKRDPLLTLFELLSRGQTLVGVRWAAECAGNRRTAELWVSGRALSRRHLTNLLKDHVDSTCAMV